MVSLEKIKNFPQKPGVYIFLDEKNQALYVGRAINLKKRVISYFQRSLPSRLKEMVNQARKISYQVTANLLEAVILEANLIKKYWPKYNIKDRDYRSFVYIVIPEKDFSYPFVARERELKKFLPHKAHIFGPYKSLRIVKVALNLIRRIFPYSLCKIGQGKPCFDYQLGLCPGGCVNKISSRDYKKNIENLIFLLEGKKKKLISKLKKENPEKIKILEHLEDVALIEREEDYLTEKNYRIEGYDISHFVGKEVYGSMVVFENNKPSKGVYRLFKIKKAPLFDDLRALEEIILRRMKHSEWPFPDLILIDGGKPQIDYLTKVFKENNIKIPFLGISKYQNDKLIFPKNSKKSFKLLAENLKPVLLKVREEAHRFALKNSRKSREKLFLEGKVVFKR